MNEVNHVAETKQLRKDLDTALQKLREASGTEPKNQERARTAAQIRASRERSLAVTKVQEAIMWLGMDLKAMNEEGVPGTENPYPQSYNPDSPRIEPTADGLKL